MNKFPNQPEDIIHGLDALVAAKWVARYNVEAGNPVIEWTDHGRTRARQLMAIDDELQPGAGVWVLLVALCRFMGPEFDHAKRN